MKKFRFNLTALLEVRRKKENIAKIELFDAQVVLENILGKLSALIVQSEKIKDEIRILQKTSAGHLEMIGHMEYLKLLNTRIARQKLVVMEALNGVEKQRAAVTAAMQNKKIIENLEDKERTEWESAFQGTEKALFDELATMRYKIKR